MYPPNRPTRPYLPVIVIGIVNVVSICVIYIAFHGVHNSAEPASTPIATTSDSSETDGGGSISGTAQTGTQASGSTTSPQNSQSGSTGGSTGSTSGSGSNSGSSSSGGTSSILSGPNSLAKGSPCKTQTPPAGVCTAVLSINSQKDGNPYWNPGLLTTIKQQIASNSYVRTLGLNPTSIYNSVQVSLKESTWKGNASHSTIGGTVSAQGQSQPATFTLDWNGSKWIVNDATLN